MPEKKDITLELGDEQRHVIHALRVQAERLVKFWEVYRYQPLGKIGYELYYQAACIEAQIDGMNWVHEFALREHRRRTIPSSR